MSVATRNKLAVALHYDKTGAPRVVAKGKGVIGARIVELARGCQGGSGNGVFKRSMPSRLIRGWIPVRVKKTRQTKSPLVIVLPRCHQHRFCLPQPVRIPP